MADQIPADVILQRHRAADVMAADCPSRQILQHLTSRWAPLVLIALQGGTHRFSALRRKVSGVSERMLSQTLQLLEQDGLVARHARDVVPPHVDYSLTPMGQAAAERVVALACWIETNLPDILAHRSARTVAAD